MIEACRFDTNLVFLLFLDEVMGALRMCIVDIHYMQCRDGCMWVGQDSTGAHCSNYSHVSFGLQPLNWIKGMTVYPILWSCAKMISSGFTFVTTCFVYGIRHGIVMALLFSISVERDIDQLPSRRLNKARNLQAYSVGREFPGERCMLTRSV